MIYVIDGRGTNIIKLMTRLRLLERKITLPGTELPLIDDVEIRRLISKIREEGFISDKLLLILISHTIDDKSLALAFYDRIKRRILENDREIDDTAIELIDNATRQTTSVIKNQASVKFTDSLIRIK